MDVYPCLGEELFEKDKMNQITQVTVYVFLYFVAVYNQYFI